MIQQIHVASFALIVLHSPALGFSCFLNKLTIVSNLFIDKTNVTHLKRLKTL